MFFFFFLIRTYYIHWRKKVNNNKVKEIPVEEVSLCGEGGGGLWGLGGLGGLRAPVEVECDPVLPTA